MATKSDSRKRNGMKLALIKHTGFMLLAASTLALSLSSTAQAGKLYKWVDEHGKIHYGDRIPPEYAKRERKTLNQQGITVDVKERAKTAEEIAEQERLAKLEAEQERLRKEQAAKDRILLDTFSNEDEMVMTRNGKVDAIGAIIRVTKGRIGKQTARLGELTSEAAQMERGGKAVPARLHEEIANTKQQIRDNESYIAQKEQEQQELRDRYEVDIERFRAIMAEREKAKAAAAAQP